MLQVHQPSDLESQWNSIYYDPVQDKNACYLQRTFKVISYKAMSSGGKIQS